MYRREPAKSRIRRGPGACGGRVVWPSLGGGCETGAVLLSQWQVRLYRVWVAGVWVAAVVVEYTICPFRSPTPQSRNSYGVPVCSAVHVE